MTEKHPESLVDVKEVEVLSDFPVSDLITTYLTFLRTSRENSSCKFSL